MRASDGTMTTFSVPGSSGTIASAINKDGVITGAFGAGGSGSAGFVRAADGTVTTFGAPNAGRYVGTTYINAAGTIAGLYTDAANVLHGFVRSSQGQITAFDTPGAGTGSGQGTYVSGIDHDV